MKKITTLTLIIMILLIALPSCNVANKDFYKIRLTSDIEGNIFNDSAEIYRTDDVTTEKYSQPVEQKLELGKKEVTAGLTEIREYSHKSSQKVFLSKDKNIEYQKSVENDSFRIQAKNKTILQSFTGESLSEQAIKSHINNYLSAYISTDILNNYVYSCRTSVVVSKTDATWKETKNEFYTPSNDTETVTSYVIEYRKYYEGFATADCITVRCNNNGDITGFYYYEHNTNWSNAHFEEKKISESVNDYLNKSISSKYKITDYHIKNQKLVVLDQDIKLAVSVEVTLDNNGDKFAVLCPLILSNE